MVQTAVCKICQRTFIDESGTVSDGLHPPRLQYLTEEVLDYVAFVKCCGCGSKIKMESVKEEFHNWSYLSSTGATFCPGCTHDLTGLPYGSKKLKEF